MTRGRKIFIKISRLNRNRKRKKKIDRLFRQSGVKYKVMDMGYGQMEQMLMIL